ncbi:nitrite/sulfite reductase [Pseudoflavonifractor sp. 524-17]|uniref:nitrite/sulfite reductase n=1 Tax=Pseudoflavonifractor sp. 524-17 TaxID=2304577 RepID=UPI00137AAA09|nr:nitrite/sulfite reductase [Pseudoflavonifractor sp. 524-17]NCE65466.1 nitrite/sulfite reductase [Pseudoflavonifractor sp. 524-17]
MEKIEVHKWKEDLPEFRAKTAAFYAGELDKGVYKGFSGYYGSYAQRGGQASMLRLRFPAGRVPQQKLDFVADVIQRYGVKRVHFTTCQTIQLHDLGMDAVCGIMEEALNAGIVTMGGGGDYPRNVMCSPLSGMEAGEYFDVLPWAEAAGDYLMHFIKAEKMPRKLKVGFSNSPRNVTHATYRDLGFAARPDGNFDVYSAGGLGNRPMMGVLVGEKVPPEEILYYIKSMWLTFRAYGNYENRGKARTRYMQESLGGAEAYQAVFHEKLKEVYAAGEDLTLYLEPKAAEKQGDGVQASGPRVIPQKQPGLYTVAWHPLGGQPAPEELCALSRALGEMPGTELRLSPDETAYLVNLTGTEARRVLELTSNGANTPFEASVSCIGGSICQVGVRDSQKLLAACVAAVRQAGLPENALPQIHISGCPSSCGTHQTGALGFRGGVKQVDGKPRPAFNLFLNGCERQGEERLGRELGPILEEEIPGFLLELGRTVAESGLDFAAWTAAHPGGVEEAAAKYLA